MRAKEAEDRAAGAPPHTAGDLVVRRPEGLYCPAGGFFIDPGRAVDRAVITHAHADHARRGHAAYLAAAPSAGVLRQRLGAITLQTLAYGEVLQIGAVRLSLHPAGHVLGSAQVRIEHQGQVWVVSGDYLVSGAGDHNPSCAPFEPVRCHCFITESTFGLPIYRWRPQQEVMAEIGAWWRANADAGRPSVLMAYSLGKAQRLLAGLRGHDIGPIVVHDAVEAINTAYRAEGVPLAPTQRLADADATQLQRALVITPTLNVSGGGGGSSPGNARLAGASKAFASGWMQLRRARQRPGLDRGFVLSDHADWPGLQMAIAATGAERVIVTHGSEDLLQRWLQQQGLQADRFATADGYAAA